MWNLTLWVDNLYLPYLGALGFRALLPDAPPSIYLLVYFLHRSFVPPGFRISGFVGS